MTSTPPGASPALAPFVKQYVVLLTSHKKDGTGVGTPVNLVVEGDHAYFRTFGRAWKAKRLRRKHPVLHGVVVPLAHRVRRDRTLHYQVRALGE
ncbi:hypothetical protein AB0B50_39205 [Streptomyces sp. NPDC041068]|uniref:pyridoxamine 5'-phosphate oxidase family protein n=1 Tax=Streptomyces sp. NPDC041068 TaxID=3155130 RepID=UPI0033EEE6FB